MKQVIDFQPLDLARKKEYDRYLMHCGQRGCEYSTANLFLWGRQRAAFLQDNLVFFSQFNRKSVYPFPVGPGDKKAALDAVIRDAQERGIPCRLTSLTEQECALLEELYPGDFRIHCDRDFYDYVYAIDDLADLTGRKFQKKRNHIHRFWDAYPNCQAEVLDETRMPQVEEMVEQWYALREQQDPKGDYHMEKAALKKALRHRQTLGMEGLVLVDGGEILAMTLGGPLSEDTFDVNFEKARPDAEGAYAAINQEFARFLRNQYPRLRFLNREDDMGLEGLRKAKLSYCPDHMVEKYWACRLEDGYDY